MHVSIHVFSTSTNPQDVLFFPFSHNQSKRQEITLHLKPLLFCKQQHYLFHVAHDGVLLNTCVSSCIAVCLPVCVCVSVCGGLWIEAPISGVQL